MLYNDSLSTVKIEGSKLRYVNCPGAIRRFHVSVWVAARDSHQ